ncbi:TPA: ABC-three component system middle component 5, partial [Salmonella enterica subsp. enterica serovar Virchow]
MLIYHPAYDAYHCLFRMIALIDHVNEIEVDKARILDFYLIFPALVSE